MSRNNVLKIIKEYVNILRKKNFNFSKIYLFGSYAKGNNTKDSDIDVAIISNNKLSDKKHLEQKMQLWEITPEVDSRIEPVLLDKSDFEKDSISAIAYEIQQNGLQVA